MPILAAAIVALADLVDFIGMRHPFGSAALQRAEEVQSGLAALREAGSGSVADSETLAARVALADEIAIEPRLLPAMASEPEAPAGPAASPVSPDLQAGIVPMIQPVAAPIDTGSVSLPPGPPLR